MAGAAAAAAAVPRVLAASRVCARVALELGPARRHINRLVGRLVPAGVVSSDSLTTCFLPPAVHIAARPYRRQRCSSGPSLATTTRRV
jgi:hypothetical protein